MRQGALAFGLAALAWLSSSTTPAAADDGSSSKLVCARNAMIQRRPELARECIEQLLARDVSVEERAAAGQLLAVSDAWSARARPRGAPRAGPQLEPDGDWNARLVAGRDLVVAGHYVDAARCLEPLVATAPDPVSSARAAELLALADAADVADSAERRESTPPTAKEWYGGPILLMDVIGTLTVQLLPYGGLPYVLGGPLVHALHRRFGASAASLGIRLATPALFGLAGFEIGQAFPAPQARPGEDTLGDRKDGYAVEGALLGIAVGMITGSILDLSLLAYERAAPRMENTDASIAPALVPRREGGGTMSVSGRF